MDVRHPIDASSGPVALSATFNQDSSCFAVGLEHGFSIFETAECKLKTTRDISGSIGQVEMLGHFNFIALVGGGRIPRFASNKVIIWDDSKQETVISLEFRTQVLRAKLSKSRIMVVLQNSVHLYKFSLPPTKISSFETADNLQGLGCLGPSLAIFPGRSPGQIQVVEVESCNVSIIPAHAAPLRALALSEDEQFLASASETGTLVRLFATSNCAKLAELRRGVDPAAIFSIAISPDRALLAVTSDKATLHVFDLPRLGVTETGEPLPSKWGVLGKLPFMPRVFSDTYSFASAPFECDDQPVSALGNPAAKNNQSIAGIPGGRAAKGILGWIDNQTVVVLGAGRDGRWEKFVIGVGDDGRRYCARTGWKRYLGS